LNSEKIEYLLIGGYAVWLYGYVRPTKDIDIWVAVDPASEARLIEVLVKFGFPRGSLHTPLFTGEKTVLRMGVPPNRIEVLSKIAGVEFRECYPRRRVMDVEGLPVSVIDYADLLRNKRATGRAGDRADAERLEKRRQSP
jgi:hypothetical protein